MPWHAHTCTLSHMVTPSACRFACRAEVLVAVRGGELVSLSKTCQINVPVPVTMWRIDDEKLTNKQTRRRNTQTQTKTRYAKL